MNRLFLYDTETTGIDPQHHQVIEVACAVYDIEHNAILNTFSALIYSEHNEAEKINGIAVGLLLNAFDRAAVWSRIAQIVSGCDAVVAHRAEFDYSFTPEMARGTDRNLPWVCSKFDVKWPNSKLGENLLNVALQHGVGVVAAHRAFTDVDILARVFGVVNRFYGGPSAIRAMLTHAMRPKVRVISLAPYEAKDIVKENGFAWRKELKVWDRMMPAEDVGALPFATRIEGRIA